MIKFSNFKTLLCLSILASFLLFAIFPLVSHASLVPCGRSDQAGGPDGMCTLCHFIIGIKGIIDYGFTIMVIVGLAMLVIAGVVYIVSAGNEGMMETAKGLMKNVLIGFALILGAWLIVTTIMWVMGTKGNLGIEEAEGWNTFKCSTARNTATNNTVNNNTNNNNTNVQQTTCGTGGVGTCTAGSWYSQCPSGMLVASGTGIDCGSGRYCCTTAARIAQMTSQTKCGTSNTGRCYPGTLISPCSSAPSGSVWLSGGTSCPSNTYCCANL